VMYHVPRRSGGGRRYECRRDRLTARLLVSGDEKNMPDG
jgi:hypothetical protein